MYEYMFIYLNLESYLADWFINECGGNPCKLKKGGAEANILELLLTRPPRDYIPDMGKDANVTIEIPSFPYKKKEFYNYMSPKAKETLIRAIYVRFRVQLWEELHPFMQNEVEISSLIYAWMESHGIDCTPNNWEAIRQMYYRKRKTYRKNYTAN